MKRSVYLGINAFHGDASAAVLAGGQLVAAVEEERFRRVKHWAGFPERSIEYCLATAADESLEAVDGIAVSRRPGAYFLRKGLLALTHPRSLGRALARARNLVQVGSLETRLQRCFEEPRQAVYGVEHHVAHAASAFFCCPWEEAMCLTVDGFGDFLSAMLAVGRGNEIEILDRVHFPHSLGLFYTAITQYLGFPNYGDEYK
ncbi:MAG: carbamoyltransferase, partial [Acidobacteriota bacterium]|nr:carbamoyltransferase [Acidobacteriota bacterium]